MSEPAGAVRIIPNIGPQGIAQRQRQGIAGLVTGGIAAIVLGLIGGAPIGLATFPLFWAGALQLLQAREKT
jgi:hypothetical protein